MLEQQDFVFPPATPTRSPPAACAPANAARSARSVTPPPQRRRVSLVLRARRRPRDGDREGSRASRGSDASARITLRNGSDAWTITTPVASRSRDAAGATASLAVCASHSDKQGGTALRPGDAAARVQRWWRARRTSNTDCPILMERVALSRAFVMVSAPPLACSTSLRHSDTSGTTTAASDDEDASRRVRGSRHRFDAVALARHLMLSAECACPLTRRPLTSLEIVRLHRKMAALAAQGVEGADFGPRGFAEALRAKRDAAVREHDVAVASMSVRNEADHWMAHIMHVAKDGALDATFRMDVVRTLAQGPYAEQIADLSRVSVREAASALLCHRRSLTHERARWHVVHGERARHARETADDAGTGSDRSLPARSSQVPPQVPLATPGCDAARRGGAAAAAAAACGAAASAAAQRVPLIRAEATRREQAIKSQATRVRAQCMDCLWPLHPFTLVDGTAMPETEAERGVREEVAEASKTLLQCVDDPFAVEQDMFAGALQDYADAPTLNVVAEAIALGVRHVQLHIADIFQRQWRALLDMYNRPRLHSDRMLAAQGTQVPLPLQGSGAVASVATATHAPAATAHVAGSEILAPPLSIRAPRPTEAAEASAPGPPPVALHADATSRGDEEAPPPGPGGTGPPGSSPRGLPRMVALVPPLPAGNHDAARESVSSDSESEWSAGFFSAPRPSLGRGVARPSAAASRSIGQHSAPPTASTVATLALMMMQDGTSGSE